MSDVRMSDSKQLGFAGASPAGLRGLKRLQRGPGGHVGWRSFVPQEGAWAGQVQNSLQGHKTDREISWEITGPAQVRNDEGLLSSHGIPYISGRGSSKDNDN